MEEFSAIEKPFDEFPPETRQDVEGLIHLGYLTDEVDFCGHTFGLRTLRAGEELAAAEVVKPYRGSLKEPEAFANAQIGLALTHVDGDDTFCPQAGPDQTTFAQARFRYTGKWFQPTLDHLFGQYARLLARQVEALRALQDLSEGSRDTSSAWPDSLTALGISADEINGETPG